MQDVWIEDISCFVSNCRKSFNCRLKKLIYEQINIFYSASNVLCSFDKPLQIKYIEHHTCIGMFSLFSRLDLQRIYVNEDTPKRMCKGEHGGQRFNKGFMVDSLSWRSYKFSQQLFLKNYYLNLKFFKYCRVLSLKRKRNLLEKDASYLKIAWHSQRQKKKHLKKRKKNEKWERVKQQQ